MFSLNLTWNRKKGPSLQHREHQKIPSLNLTWNRKKELFQQPRKRRKMFSLKCKGQKKEVLPGCRSSQKKGSSRNLQMVQKGRPSLRLKVIFEKGFIQKNKDGPDDFPELEEV